MAEYYHSLDPSSGDEDDDAQATEDSSAAAARNNTLTQPAPPSSSSAVSAANPPRPQEPKKKFGTLKDLQNDGGSGGHGHGHGHEDDDEKDTEYFAGGDKSGLAVQDRGSGSRDQIQRLLNTARRFAPCPDLQICYSLTRNLKKWCATSCRAATANSIYRPRADSGWRR